MSKKWAKMEDGKFQDGCLKRPLRPCITRARTAARGMHSIGKKLVPGRKQRIN